MGFKNSTSGAIGDSLFDKLRRFTMRIEADGDPETRKRDYKRLIEEMVGYLGYGGPFFADLPSCFDDKGEVYFLLELIAVRGAYELPFRLVLRKFDLYGCAFKSGGKWYEYKSQDIFTVGFSPSGVNSVYEDLETKFGPSMLVDAIEFFNGDNVVSQRHLAQKYMELVLRLFCEPCRISRLFEFSLDTLGGEYYSRVEIPLIDLNIIKMWGGVSNSTIDAKFAENHVLRLEVTSEDNVGVNFDRTNICDAIGVHTYEEAKKTLGILKVENDKRIEARLKLVGKELLKSFKMPKKPKKEESQESFWSEEFIKQSSDPDMKKSLMKFQQIVTDGKNSIAENLLKKLGIYEVDIYNPTMYVLNGGQFRLPNYLFYTN